MMRFMREKSSDRPPLGALMWPSSDVPASHVHDVADLVRSLDPDHSIRWLVGDPGDGVGVLAADLGARLQPVAEALAQNADGGGYVFARGAVGCCRHRPMTSQS
jgi:hypothetical protein